MIESLLDHRAFPHPVTDLALLETHISWVILTGPFAYKIKKPVKLDFLDFSTLERRKHYCEEELRLNKRWAPDLYLDVVPIAGPEDAPRIGGDGVIIDYALKMAQFPYEARLDKQLDAGLLKDDDLLELAETVASVHADAEALRFVSDDAAIERVRAPMRDNFPPVEPHADEQDLQRIRDWTERSLRELEGLIVKRHGDGFVREGHGDLHLRNLVRLDSQIVAFDCVEFSRELRTIDVISDISFLAMDLIGRGRRNQAYVFLNRYLECTGDYDGMALYGLYFVYHCMIRAKVAAIRCSERAQDDEAGRREDLDEIEHYLSASLRWINRKPPVLIAMHGYSGSGKTWLSNRLLSRVPALRVRSDIERKRLFQLAEAQSSDSDVGGGIYTPKARADVYEGLTDLAALLLRAGLNVFIDASFLSRKSRQLVAGLARKLATPYVLVSTSAKKDELLRRLRSRRLKTTEASEADADVLAYQFEHADALQDDELENAVLVATDEGIDPDKVVREIRRRAIAFYAQQQARDAD